MDTYFRIRELRKARGMTQAELAAELSLRSSGTVAMWESGERRPPSVRLPELARALGCDVGALYAPGKA